MGIPFLVIDNGNRVAGTQLDMLSEEAAAALSDADVILAKGMANAETMLGCVQRVLRISGKMPAVRHPLRQAHVHPHAGEGTGVKKFLCCGGSRGIFAVRNGAGWAGGSILCSS